MKPVGLKVSAQHVLVIIVNIMANFHRPACTLNVYDPSAASTALRLSSVHSPPPSSLLQFHLSGLVCSSSGASFPAGVDKERLEGG